MEAVSKFNEFEEFLKSENCSFSLLYKNGKPVSNCAISNLKDIVAQKNQIIGADVNQEHDIHMHNNISTVPKVLEIEMGIIKNIVKACQDKAFFSTIFKNPVANVDGMKFWSTRSYLDSIQC